MLGVVDAQIAVLVRGVEGADDARAIPVGEVLGARVGVLQRGQELQAALDRLAVALVPGDVADLAGHAARLDHALGVDGAVDRGRRLDRSAVLAAHEAAVPEHASGLDLGVLQAAQPVGHLEDEIGKALVLGRQVRLAAGRRLVGDEGHALVVLPPGAVVRQGLARRRPASSRRGGACG